MQIQNDKQKIFFEEAIPFDRISKKMYSTENDLLNELTSSNHFRSNALADFQSEIEDNLTLFTETNTRVSYLKRILIAIERSTSEANNLFETLELQVDYEYSYNRINEKQIHFKISSKRVLVNLKSSLFYLNILSSIIYELLEIDDPKLENTYSNEIKNLIDNKFPKFKWNVSKAQCYDVFKQLYAEKWITNNYEEMTELIFNFFQFSKGKHPTKSTISAELKRKSIRPIKNKRFIPPVKKNK